MLKIFAIVVTTIYIFGTNILLCSAQNKRSPQPSPSAKTTDKKTKQPSPEELEQQAKIDFALSLIDSLAEDARKYKNRVASVRVQAKAADLIWERDSERARTIFLRAWTLAETVEEEEQKLVEEKKKKFLSGESQNGFIPSPPNLRGEILQFVGRRDRKLSEELLARLEKKNEEDADSEKDDFDPTEPDLATARRLELALYLLENGETEKALAIADISLHKATTQGIVFLLALRKKSPAAADARFSSLLSKSVVDPTSDATSVSLLSSYVFTPTVIVTMTQNGTLSRRLDEVPNAAPISERLKADFLRAAAQILLRPLPILVQDKTSAGRDGLFFTITRLLPLFAQYLPDKVSPLQSQLNSIVQNVSDANRARTDFFANAGFSSDEPQARRLEDILQEIESSPDNKKDNLYAQAARLAAMKNDLRARDYAEKIYDSKLKDKVFAFVDFVLVQKAIEKKDADQALTLLKKAKLPQLQRIWLMTEIARLFDKKRAFEAQQLLEEAVTEARKINGEESWKANALSAVANAFLAFDELRSWQITADVVKAANTAAFFNDKPDLSASLQIGGEFSVIKPNTQSLNIANLFAQIAPYDIYQASNLAGNLSDEYQRALSLLASADSQIKKRVKK